MPNAPNVPGRTAHRARRHLVLVGLFTAALIVLAAVEIDSAPVALAVIVLPPIAISLLLAWDRRRLEAAEVALARAEERLHLLFHSNPEPMWVHDDETLAVIEVNPAAVRAFGWSRSEFTELTIADLLDAEPDDLRRTMRTLPDSTAFAGEWRYRTRDGALRWASITTQAVIEGGRTARLCIAHDVTDHLEIEEKTRAILDQAADAILTVDLDGTVESVNVAAERMFGRSADEMVGADVSSLMLDHEETRAGGHVKVDQRGALRLGREVTGRRSDGTTFPLELTVTEVELGARTISTVVARDVSERKAYERRLAHQGTHDALTGLPNRVFFMDHLAHAIGTAHRTNRQLAVLFCDLDRFKVVNDGLGHSAGDALLFAVANRFRAALREGDLIARFGGDEFVVLAEQIAGEGEATAIAEKLAQALREPITIGNDEIVVSASIGIALGDAETSTPEALVRDADVAMYRAKARGRACHEVFDADLRRQALQRMDTESAMRRGTGLREFVVHYQPEVHLATDRVVGVEALVRWDHPEHGLTSPANFLPVAEETGLIVTIGEQVFEQACAQAAAWYERLGDHAPTVWVNLSARQLASPKLVEVIAEAVRSILPSPSILGLEITETDIVPDDEDSRHTVQQLSDLGVRLAIDDFGTGFASLSYLWRFPADVVKIDQTFVHRLDHERDATVLIAAMIQLAHSLGKTTVAEGVETEEQLVRLRRLGCDTVQGYLLGRPAPAPDIEHLLVTR
jgi:diguanylate cyclase (GGDEF)-like protein/PAS domain S-box-containing protein